MIKRYEGNGKLSRVVEYNGILYLSGRAYEAGVTIEEQTKEVLHILDETLNRYGSDKEHILTAQIFMSDIKENFDRMNKVWKEYIEPGYEPARVTFQAETDMDEILIEISMTAAVKE